MKRGSKTILRILQDAISRTLDFPKIIITDDFSSYKRAAKLLKYNLVHIRHIHRPPYGRMVIDIHKYEQDKLVITSVATLNDIFKFENTFITRISKKEIKLIKNKRRGRKKGSKNNRKSVNSNKGGKITKNKKRGPSNHFKIGTTYVYHYYINNERVRPLGSAPIDVAEILEVIAREFKGKCITTNIF